MKDRTTLEEVDDTNFIITYSTVNHKKTENISKPIYHKGLEWIITVFHKGIKLCFFLECYDSTSRLWSVKVKTISELKDTDIRYENTTEYNWRKADREDIYKGRGTVVPTFPVVTVVCTVKILAMNGVSKNEGRVFPPVADRFSNVTVMLKDGVKLCVNKGMLICFSPVFQSMLYTDATIGHDDFQELNLESIDSTDFTTFLQLLHHDSVQINSTNVGAILELADQFQTDMIIDKCEKYLLSSPTVKIVDMLFYAEKYRLVHVQNQCCARITTLQQIFEIMQQMEESNTMGEQTSKHLLKLLMKHGNS